MKHQAKVPFARLLTASALGLSILASAPALAGASNASPVGTWKTIDDDTGKAKSIVEITERNGKLRGRVVRVIDKDTDRPLCTECEGKRHNQPIEGMTILWGLEPDDEDSWDSGRILDPGNGETYSCTIDVKDAGRRLAVRGYIGFSLLGRTQVWHRVK